MASPRGNGVGVWQLLGHTRQADPLRDAWAWVIATRCAPGAVTFVPALGLDYPAFRDLLDATFPHFSPPADWLCAQRQAVSASGPLAEFHDLLQLFLDHRARPDETHRRICHLIAAASMGGDHLWQDLGLSGRDALSTLLSIHFPTLAAKNTGDMKWKKFFYRQLCEREGYVACARPSCAACSDYANCFGPEV